MSLLPTSPAKKSQEPWIFRDNSLDLIRLLAAGQVVVLHAFEFTMAGVTDSLFFRLLELIPGVPVFFFISGLLISRSFERAPTLGDYSRNRALRIFPALVVCVFINLVMVWSTGYFDIVKPSALEVTALFLAKVTFLQFYNPDFMREFGDGVLNGSLWTVCVELQFYVLVPMLYAAIKFLRINTNLVLISLIVLGMIANRFLYLSADAYSDEVLWKLYRVSFIPWFYMFLAGMLFQRNFELIAKSLQKVPMLWLFVLYMGLMYVMSVNGLRYGNSIPPYVFFPLALLVFRFAYYKPAFTQRLLNGNDISYGIYIWHMPLVNQLLYLKPNPGVLDVFGVIIGSIVLAWLSWVIVERPAMRLKRFTLKRRSPDATETETLAPDSSRQL